jgi:eukaryotic translation initiation factor 2C
MVDFLDHLLREGPSRNPRFIPAKRQFFIRDGQRAALGGGIEVFRGVYQSLRLADNQRLIINLDVANSCFWQPTSLLAAIIAKMRLRDPQGIAQQCRPVQSNGTKKASQFQKLMSKNFRKVLCKAKYAGCPVPDKEWNIKDFALVTANEHMIEMKDTGKKQTVAQYFKTKYNVSLQFPNLPLVEMTKKDVMYPMEFLHLIENQRYPFKLDETQTANMIKFAVTRPEVRNAAINEGKGWLDWSADRICNQYGLKINPNMLRTKARLLPSPDVQFGGSAAKPGTAGRWDLRGKKFLSTNPQELVSWGVGVFGNADKPMLEKFAKDFAQAYRQHGGKVASAPPNLMKLPNDPAQAVESLHNTTGNMFKRRPQLLIFIVQDKNSFHYLRIKKSCDCRFGVVSQVLQFQQVRKGNPQYYSNVLMKVNAKLGGTTAQAKSDAKSGFKAFPGPTMVIGADVSHASPGSDQASMAALTVSFDKFGGRYAAACQTNGKRVEIITEANWGSMLGPLATQWVATVGGGRVPSTVYYFRDGVSEGQFVHVMQQEVPHIKAVLTKIQGSEWKGKITVTIASKRHHVRGFPVDNAGADKNKNPLPGVLIERDCTMPFEWDFYLYSHIALQGTARPVHYTIIHDESSHPPNVIQNMIYDHCYQYMRSTTSVSMYPAVYYAHLASNRAKAHENIPSSEGPQGGPGFKQNQPAPESDVSESEVRPLMAMFPVNGIQFAMWYI